MKNTSLLLIITALSISKLTYSEYIVTIKLTDNKIAFYEKDILYLPNITTNWVNEGTAYNCNWLPAVQSPYLVESSTSFLQNNMCEQKQKRTTQVVKKNTVTSEIFYGAITDEEQVINMNYDTRRYTVMVSFDFRKVVSCRNWSIDSLTIEHGEDFNQIGDYCTRNVNIKESVDGVILHDGDGLVESKNYSVNLVAQGTSPLKFCSYIANARSWLVPTYDGGYAQVNYKGVGRYFGEKTNTFNNSPYKYEKGAYISTYSFTNTVDGKPVTFTNELYAVCKTPL